MDLGSGQTGDNVEQNITFFSENLESYNSAIQNLDTYVHIRSSINKVIQGIDTLLDIGNGGVFDYDVKLVSKIIGLDLFFDKLPSSYHCPENVTLKTGSALDIPESDNSFDGVLMAFLIHHIVGNSVKASINNVKQSIHEAHRVLKPGGKMIIAESCVPRWFYQFEKLVFPVASKLIDKIFNHPHTLQYPASTLEEMLAEKFNNVRVIDIPLGRWVLIYGIKVPTLLTPVNPKIFIAEKC